MKLLYHPITAESNVSPFDEAILEVATGQSIQIISPYLGLSYLRRLTSCCQDWRLVSDIEEWLSAAKNERPQAFEFIKAHRDKIHHYEALHAKAVVGLHKAYLGSANLTDSGIRLRTEIGVQLDEPDAVRELNVWADRLWDVTQSPGVEELETFFQQMSARARTEASSIEKKPKLKLAGVSLRVRAKLSDTSAVAVTPATAPPEPVSVQDAMGLFAREGLSLHELFELLSDGSSKSRRHIMAEVFGLCANLGRSAYCLENEQKLVWDGQRLQQATPSSVQEALTPYDKFLTEVINRLGFEQPKPFVDITKAAVASAVPGGYAKRLLTELTQVGLLVSEAGMYALNDEIDWPPSKKYYQFKRAGIAWEAAIERARKARREGVILPSIVPEEPKLPLVASVPWVPASGAAVSLPHPLTDSKEATPERSSERVLPATSREQKEISPEPEVQTRGMLNLKGVDLLCSTVLELAIESNGFLAYASEYQLFQAIEQRCDIPPIFYGILTGAKNIPCAIAPPFKLTRVIKSKGWLVSRSRIFKKNLATLPATQQALDRYLKMLASVPESTPGHVVVSKTTPPPPSGNIKISIISRIADAHKEVSKDAIFLEMARLLEQSKGNLGIKESKSLFNYIAVKLNTTSSRVAEVLTEKTAAGRYGPAPLFSVRDGDGKILVEINPGPRSRLWYPKTANYLNGLPYSDSYLAIRIIDALVEAKNPPKLSKYAGNKVYPSNTRLDHIQFALLKLADKSGTVRALGLNEVHHMILSFIPDLAHHELEALTKSFKRQPIIPPIFLRAVSTRKFAQVLIRNKHGSMVNYPLTAALLRQHSLPTHQQP